MSSSRAFEYDSIRDGQQNLELWRDIGATIVIIGVSIVCPPAGLALGIAYGTLELSSAATGKDWMTGREMDGTERATRGAFALLDIIPGVKGIRAFSTATKAGGLALDATQVGSKLTLRQTAQQGLSHVDAMGRQALRESAERIRNVPRVISDVASSAKSAAKTQLRNGAIQAGKLTDETATTFKSIAKSRVVATHIGTVHIAPGVAENTHRFENVAKGMFGGGDEAVSTTGRVARESAEHIDDVPRLNEIEVSFNRNTNHDAEEFVRQLKDQEHGMNELTVEEYLANRERYIEDGRALEGNAAQQVAREQAYIEKYDELRDAGYSAKEAKQQTNEWLDTQAALHNPDQIAGGKADIIGGMGDRRINSSIGSQWRYRIDMVDEQISEMAKHMTPNQLKNTYLNVKLTH
ncbi:polymorphic toxin type 15 domain-containing protein [Listeria rocourtiae]|uniref:polymorphic toxin type 15 domain-containing protein n=1 Tax=Listeria rocourtiae TaxID=647910 RepID=UPI0003E87972|nr:polymorphic toxin type 15 domain-containing protein [Listeria rocourtiae]EUJ43737.1 hypothetical protein PROCOU_15179 [Listeria rocourtiae FSL F6-920]